LKLVHRAGFARLSADARRGLFEIVRGKEAEDSDLAAADGTLELLVRETEQPGLLRFKVLGYTVTAQMRAVRGLQTTPRWLLSAKTRS
jgi:hypothetical protein